MSKDKKKKVVDVYQFDDSRKMKDSDLVKRLSVYIKPYWLEMALIIISVIISSFFVTYISRVFGEALDLLDAEAEFKEILKKGYIILGSLVLSFTLTYFRGIALSKIGQKILVKLREELFSHIEHLSLRELDKTPVGTFVTRVANDTNALSDLFTNVLVSFISNFMTMIYGIIFMVITSWKLTLIVFATIPILVIATFIFRKYSRLQFRKVTYNNSRLNAFLSENLSGMKITQIFNREEAKLEEFDELSERLMRSHKGSVRIFAFFRPFIFAIYLTATILTFYFGAKFVMAGDVYFGIPFTSGLLYSFYHFLQSVFNPIQNIAQQYNTLQSAFASAEKIYTILDTKSSIEFIDEPIVADNFKGEIEFKNVSFRYNKEDSDWIIHNVSFHIEPGKTVAFVGPTGAGKTTILSLLMRYYDVDEGEILIDGVNVKYYDIYSLRNNIGEMLQDVFLFTGTIKENITLREESITDEEIIESSKYVNADSFINKLPNKYDEFVKERGNNYSQGQRQLLSFARTIVHHPKMIILDEATSNIDTETEVLIQDSLEKIKSIGTTIMVAHRLSTIQHSDIIMFLDHGEIIEMGNHQELLKKEGRYYDLFKLQYDKA
ncbi:MAG: ABC transporter ATP-binding protein/permease [Gammaproteobacteria bacterium]|nr:ABC transporter ATP-binding protein/permease [Gammaproteobacteria bacterium]